MGDIWRVYGDVGESKDVLPREITQEIGVYISVFLNPHHPSKASRCII